MVLGAESVKADFTFGEPTNLGPTVNSPANEQAPSISADGLEFYFTSDRPGGLGQWDLWVTTRADDKEAAADHARALGYDLAMSSRV